MNLLDYQKIYLDELYNKIVNNSNDFIDFTGPKGCGKSVIVNELSNQLMENWKVFMITGSSKLSPPFYTWYSASKKTTKSKNTTSEVSFGINFQPLGLPIGANMNVSYSKKEKIFNTNELALINVIKQEVSANENVLFIADDYNSWDYASREFLMKLYDNYLVLGSDKHITIVRIDTHIIDEEEFDFVKTDKIKVSIEDIPHSDIESYFCEYVKDSVNPRFSIDDIIRFTGYDLRLITLAVHYQKDNTEIYEINSFSELLEKRLINTTDTQHNICRTLEHVSIINSLFSEKEASFLLGEEPIKTEKALNEAVKMKLISKTRSYDFPIKDIRNYFEARLDIEKKYLHQKFANYLKMNCPEDYQSRSYHLFQSYDAIHDSNQLESVYMKVIEILRRKEVTFGSNEIYLEEELVEYIEVLPQIIKSDVKLNIERTLNGFHLLTQCDYIGAILNFEIVNLMYTTKVFSIEVKRLSLLCQLQLADDLDKIKQLADEIFTEISQNDFNEDELWCNTALLLMEVYGDRHVRGERFKYLKKEFSNKIQKHLYQNTFQNFYAKYTTKSILFFAPNIAVELTEKSCNYYREYNSISNLYFSLCNNGANRIICGDYKNALIRLTECRDIIKNNETMRFPSTYKIDNNYIITKFLQSEGAMFDIHSKDREAILSAAKIAINELSEIRNKQGFEVSHIIELNLLSMLMISDEKERANEILKKFELEYSLLDNFYKYYYHNACCAKHILIGKHEIAKEHLDTLKSLEVILLSESSRILHLRNIYLEQLIEERFIGDPFTFNYEFIRRGMRKQDNTSVFWGRGFLLSDLQFLSL